MKVIDLLNKIANGEEVPKKIKVFGDEFEFLYQSGDKTYFNNDGDYLFSDVYDWENNLNSEVEIIEDKKIEKLDLILDEQFSNDELQVYIKETQEKVNEIIDYLEENK